ncbi:hypothetical protein D3C81_2056340 [compost metagenome]
MVNVPFAMIVPCHSRLEIKLNAGHELFNIDIPHGNRSLTDLGLSHAGNKP